MSDINLDFTVSNNSINFTVEPNEITITPTDIQLTIAAGGLAIPSGPTYGVQYDNNGVFGASDNFKFYPSNATIAVTNILVGNNAAFTSNINDVHISGGTNGYVLQTDGTGNLSWTAQSGGGGGNGTPGGSNTQIQYNDAGTFGGNVGFTFNEVTGNVAIPGNLAVTGNITGNVQTAYIANYAAVANSVAGANVTGTVANATYAVSAGSANTANISNIAGTVTTNAQPNITSVGTLTSFATTGTSTVQQIKEKVTPNATGATGTVNFDILTSAIILQTTNATANFTLNFRGNSTTTFNSVANTNESVTCSYVNKNGATAYVPTSITIDGSAPTVVWASNTANAGLGTVNGYDMYTFNLVKTAANTYVVFSSRTGFI